MDFDTIVKNGIIVTSSEVLSPGLEIGIKDGKIMCIGLSLPSSPSTKIIDAEGAYITPGGIDSHVHLAQDNSPTGDDWETGSRSAIAGGNTVVLAFATQERNQASLYPVVEDYHKRSRNQSYCDYSFHLILTNPSPSVLNDELPSLAADGITSLKLYMTYDPLKLTDKELITVLMAARKCGMTTMIHAENHDMIAHITNALESFRLTEPYYHAVSRPQIAEDEATYRIIALANLADAPILLVHMSASAAVKHVRKAQGKLLPIHAETCPQYLFLLSSQIKGTETDPFSGAKCVCSPPLRHDPKDLQAMWQHLANGTFTTFSSDHAPSTYNHPAGKKLGLVDGIPSFKKIPNGLPGVETRLPLLFSAALDGKISLPRFVQLTSTNPAKLYGMNGTKGSIAVGYDADLVIWYPDSHDFSPSSPSQNPGITITQEILHHGVDYTPYEGMIVRNWPR
ncbi:MAG: hypothetical protein M1834_008512, partial [Cirrosporium novae-zelandiae]